MHRGKSTGSFSPAVLTSQLSTNSPAKWLDPNSSSLTGVTSESFWKHVPSSSWIGLDMSEACFDNESVGNMTPMVVILRVLAISKFSKFHQITMI